MSESLPTTFDFDSDINDATPPPPLPEGEYPATVQSVVVKPSKNTGKPVAHIELLVSSGAYPPDFADGDPDGTKLMDYRTVHSERRNLYMVKQAFTDYGVKIRRKGDGTSSIDWNDLQGQDVLVTVKHETYQGRTNPKVAAVRAA